MDTAWVLVALVFPWLTAAYTFDKLYAVRPEAFSDPGGWRLPKAEVAWLASVWGSLVFVAGVLG